MQYSLANYIIYDILKQTKEEQMPRSDLIVRRLRLAREEKNITQEDLSIKMGFKDRQTLAAVETGQRKLSAEELTRAMQLLSKPLEFFTDPYQISDKEGVFHWRAKASPDVLSDCEMKIRRLIVAYRRFGELLGKPHVPPELSIPIRKSDSFEKVNEIAEYLVEDWGLGEIPANSFPDILEEKFDFLVLGIDEPKEKISGAFCQFPEFATLVTNIHEVTHRQNFNIAHELFHLLTWKTISSREVEPTEIKFFEDRRKEEQLANTFAAALLLPKKSIIPRFEKRENGSIETWINKTSEEFGVSAEALFWRLYNLNQVGKSDVERGRLKSRENINKKKYRHLSNDFVEKLHMVLDKGLVSAKKVSESLDMTLEEIGNLFKQYEKPLPFKT